MAGGRRSRLADIIDGAIAGVVATWALDRVTTWLYEREDGQARRREDDARGGKTAYAVAAEKTASLVGRTLTNEESEHEGARIHWALGAATGALYGAWRGRTAQTTMLNGLLFGTAVFLLMDEGLVYALNLTPGPTKFPWQAHARGLAGHLAFGAAAEGTLRVLQQTA